MLLERFTARLKRRGTIKAEAGRDTSMQIGLRCRHCGQHFDLAPISVILRLIVRRLDRAGSDVAALHLTHAIAVLSEEVPRAS